ncbi:MAG: succinate dehydrogenase [Planctomycetes bacterium RIFCSPHIGHO2_02_FULL_40_12]|nr:MAG: succinate dehydrogenase [Planctomycetes bacterium RIFCSPHIGHO2_02_FULL_40_12]
MNWFIYTLRSSIGKKLIMALTGLVFCIFLIGHLAGNLIIYAGKDAFNSYAGRLHALGPVIILTEIGLLFFAVAHVFIGSCLFYENFRARPGRYLVKKNAGGRTIGSGTMPYTGFFILIFIIFHLIDFHFADKTDQTIYQIVLETFSNPGYAFFYIVSMIIVSIHVSHGFWSAFQTLGVDNSEYMSLLRVIGIIFSMAVGFGFGLLPIYISFIS